MEERLDARQWNLGPPDSVEGTTRLGDGIHLRRDHEICKRAETVTWVLPESHRTRDEQLCEARLIEVVLAPHCITQGICRDGDIALVTEQVDDGPLASGDG
jgi:hypothetical protein